MRGINTATQKKISVLQFNLISQKHLMLKKENLILYRLVGMNLCHLTAGKESDNCWKCKTECYFRHLMSFLRD